MIQIFDSDIAAEYGIPCAILLNSIAYWVKENEANKRNEHDGKYWTYNSIDALQELFPYLSKKQIRSALDKLTSEGLIEKGTFNESPFDRTLWYTMTPKGHIEMPHRANENCPTGQMINNNTIEYNNTINTNNNSYGDSQESTEKPHPSDDDEFFESLWVLYPKKKGKTAVKKTQRKRLHKVGYDALKGCIDRYKEYIDSHGVDEQYIMYGSTFFNGRYAEYLDDDSPTVITKPKGGGRE